MKDFIIRPSEFDFVFYKGSGKGGQKRNKTENCSKCFHKRSSANAYSEKTRSTLGNKKDSFKKIFYTSPMIEWIKNDLFNGLKDVQYNVVFIESENSLGIIAKIQYLGVKNTKRKPVVRKKTLKDKNKVDRMKAKKDLSKY